MNDSEAPEPEIDDALWAEFGATYSIGPDPASGDVTQASKAPARETPGVLLVAGLAATTICISGWLLGRLWSAAILAVAVVVSAVTAYWLRRRAATSCHAEAPHPMVVRYVPPLALPDPQEAALEERLLHLCKEDRRLFDRLLRYERRQYPEKRGSNTCVWPSSTSNVTWRDRTLLFLAGASG